MAITSKKINLAQLDAELGSKGLVADFNDPNAKIIIPAENSDVTEEELQNAIESHTAVFPEVSIADKLAQVGLNLDDLKAALGL